MVSRRFFLSAAAAGAASAAWVGFVEPSWFQLTHTHIPFPGIKPKKILHLSDLHVSDGMAPKDLIAGLKAGLAHKPDLVCFTGDYISYSHGFDARGLRHLLQEAAGSAATYAVMGNHDGFRMESGLDSPAPLIDLMAPTGVHVLENRALVHDDLNLVGMADLWSHNFQPQQAFANVDAAKPTLVLSHNPDSKAALRNFRWNVMLSGHTHGGQARIPGLTRYWAPVKDKRFLAGLYDWQGKQLFITRGLGSPRHVRAFCRPEVSILHLG